MGGRTSRRQGERRSWRPDISGATGPLYLAIADALGADIAAGTLRPGDPLPTHRALAPLLGVDLTTVTRAYGEARRRGLIDAATGRGTFVKAAGRPAAPALGIDLSMNMPPRPDWLAERLAATMAALLRDGGAGLLAYQPSGGLLPDREAGARWLAPLLPDLTAERVLVTGGAQAGLMALLTLLARPGDVVLAEALCYPGLRAAAAQLGLRLEGVAMDSDGVRPDALDEACRRWSPRAFYCVPTLHNPTGLTWSPARRAEIAAVARARALTIIEDDAYGLLPAGTPAPLAALAPDLTWYLATLAKTLTPALRVAYLVAPDAERRGRAEAALRAVTQMAPPLSVAAATRWIGDGTAADLLRSVREESRARQALARSILPLGGDAGEGHHVWLGLPDGRNAADFAARLRRSNLAVVPDDAFAVAPPSIPALRLSLGAATDRAQLSAGLRLLADALAQAPDPLLHIV
ncbi:MAG TPA: PLP-dependent aminotransferase family protein [Azospirillaceae bacterium]|nr:PLP-dependent aminotransferase family protein [Azospirillaceae bacterium]